MTDATNDEGETPLIIACMKGNLTVVRLLIGAGADANKTLPDGNSPLHFAAWSGNKFIGSDLMAAHAQVDTQNRNGETPLILAAREGNNDFVSLLVEHGANVNLADNLQHTALEHFSSWEEYGTSFIMGRGVWHGDPDDSETAYEIVSLLLEDDESPWKKSNFNIG